jgi:nucleoside-diphosphate-sugar epimerase
MKILFTGASSFTGYWFVRYLFDAGHDITVVLRKSKAEEYQATRRERIRWVAEHCSTLWNCAFGDYAFIDILNISAFDILCHHGADVTNYRSPLFDPIQALQNNILNLSSVLQVLQKRNGALILTGSVFEQHEALDSEDSRAITSYGLSKGLTSEVVKFYAREIGVKLGKFVIPNPFGPFEEQRFTYYLMRTWFRKQTASVQTPHYIRDNIHVSLLAIAYRRFIEEVFHSNSSYASLHPSGYVESQGTFTQRFSHEMRSRLSLTCEFNLEQQALWQEPRIRINTMNAQDYCPEWNEIKAWDDIAHYYYQQHKLDIL